MRTYDLRPHLRKSHLLLAHELWAAAVTKEDFVIDATAGNGHDSAFLATIAGRVLALDIQEEAVQATRNQIGEKVEVLLGSHENLSAYAEPTSVQLIVYNLGYLPGGDKGMTTLWETTHASLESAKRVLKPGGFISIMAYPGHPEGRREEEELAQWCAKLAEKSWLYKRWQHRPQGPVLYWVSFPETPPPSRSKSPDDSLHLLQCGDAPPPVAQIPSQSHP